MKETCKLLCAVILGIFLLLVGNWACAYQTVIPDSIAIERSRISYIMRDVNGAIYNLYIIGDGEIFVGAQTEPWRKTEWDEIYEASSYNAYLTGPNSNNAVVQSVNLFGKNKVSGYKHRLNLTNPTWRSGIYLIKGVNGQPDILVTAYQMAASFVDYRFFAIKNGELRPLKLMFGNQRTSTRMIGIHKPAYGLADGTIAIPWFRQRMPGPLKPGNFITVFMPDFDNFILIAAYTIEAQ